MSARNENIIEGTEDFLKKFKVTTFELLARGKSSFVKDGTGGDSGVPSQYLSTNKNLMLEPVSRLFLGEGRGYRATQYVIDAGTIYVEDYYEDEKRNLVLEEVTKEQAEKKRYQFRPGLKSQGFNLRDEFKRSMELGISFEFGKLDISKYGDSPMLLRFISEHELNVEAPRAKDNKNPKGLRLFMFKPSIPERDAAKSEHVLNIDADAEALVYAASLRKKTTKGFEYNEDKLDAILSILESGVGLKDGDVHQKFDIIARLAKKDGSAFMELINGVTDQYKVNIALGEQYEVLTIGAKEVKAVKDTQNTVIFTLSAAGLTKDQSIDELVIHFLSSPAGRNDFVDLAREIEQAKIRKA